MNLRGQREFAKAESLSSVLVSHTRATMRIDKKQSSQSLVRLTKSGSVGNLNENQAEKAVNNGTRSQKLEVSSRDIIVSGSGQTTFDCNTTTASSLSKSTTEAVSGPISETRSTAVCRKFGQRAAIGAAIRMRDMAESYTGLRRMQSMPHISQSSITGAGAPLNSAQSGVSHPDHMLSNLLKLPKRVKPNEYNEKRACQLASNIVEYINDAGTCILTSLAHQLGLFTAMAKINDRPRSVSSIARVANGLNSRYTQELLSALTCAGIVEESNHKISNSSNKDGSSIGLTLPWMSNLQQQGATTGAPLTGRTGSAHLQRGATSQIAHHPQSHSTGNTRTKYILPKEHALLLTWGNGSDNLALLTQYISALGRVEDEVVSCFRSGEGLDWTRYGQFDLVSELDTQQTIGGVFCFEEEILSMVPGFRDLLVSGTSILCLGSGVGTGFASIAQAFPKSWFTVYEGNSQKAAAAGAMHENIPNLHFAALSANSETFKSCAMLENRTYTGALIIDASIVRDAPNPGELLQRVHGALRPGASLLMLEYVTGCAGAAPLITTMSALQSVPLGIAAGGPALGRCWGATAAARALRKAGFCRVDVRHRQGDDINRVVVAIASNGNEN